MTLDGFRQSLTATEPPAGLTLALAGLWWDAKGDWTRAHESAQQDEGIEGSWVHAYLHRKEGDQGNAAYCHSASSGSRHTGLPARLCRPSGSYRVVAGMQCGPLLRLQVSDASMGL